MFIHKEGKRTLAIVFIFLIIVVLSMWRLDAPSVVVQIAAVVGVVLMCFLLYFFRDPRRDIKEILPQAVYAPADGKIVMIEDTIESEYFEDERLMISIFMSPFNVHSNHHPVSGTIAYKKYHPGKYLVAWHPKSSTKNERTTVVYDTGSTKILVRQIAGFLARRIVNYVKDGDEVVQGGQMGFIKFGSRVDVFLPVGTKYNVELGQTVQHNIDVIATLGDSPG